MATPRYRWLRLRATAHPTEDPERVKQAMAHLAGLEPSAFEDALVETRLDTHHGGTAWLLDLSIERSRAARDFIDGLAVDIQTAVVAELDARLDDDGVLYLRFDKQAAFAAVTRLASDDDAIQIRVKPEVHPRSRTAAMEALSRALSPPTPL